MLDWYKKVVFENYANFNGRARRSEYWYFILMNLIIDIVLMIFDEVLGLKIGSTNSGVLNSLYSIAILVPSIAVAVRRLHDIGKSGWLLLMMYAIIIAASVALTLTSLELFKGGGLPAFGIGLFVSVTVILGMVIWMLVLFCIEGTHGENQYGDDPKKLEL